MVVCCLTRYVRIQSILMTAPDPLYTSENCHPAYQLNWAISLFVNEVLAEPPDWLEGVRTRLETDGVRILEYHPLPSRTLQFLLSTRPDLAPSSILRLLKGRTQYALRARRPRAFRRNYRLESVGSAKQTVLDAYLARQPLRHPLVDLRSQETLEAQQIYQPDVDLTAMRYSAHGQFLYNLHLVVEHEGGWCTVDVPFWQRTRGMLLGICKKKNLLLGRAGVAGNHLHLALGCGIEDAPGAVALCFLNNLAYGHDTKPIYRFGYYAGTFGNFDLGALWNARRRKDET